MGRLDGVTRGKAPAEEMDLPAADDKASSPSPAPAKTPASHPLSALFKNVRSPSRREPSSRPAPHRSDASALGRFLVGYTGEMNVAGSGWEADDASVESLSGPKASTQERARVFPSVPPIVGRRSLVVEKDARPKADASIPADFRASFWKGVWAAKQARSAETRPNDLSSAQKSAREPASPSTPRSVHRDSYAYRELVEEAWEMMREYRDGHDLPEKSFDFSPVAAAIRKEIGLPRLTALGKEVSIFLSTVGVFAKANRYLQNGDVTRAAFIPRTTGTGYGEMTLDSLAAIGIQKISWKVVLAAYLARTAGNMVGVGWDAVERERERVAKNEHTLEERKTLFLQALEERFPRDDSGIPQLSANIARLDPLFKSFAIDTVDFTELVDRRMQIYCSRPKPSEHPLSYSGRPGVKAQLMERAEFFPAETQGKLKEWINLTESSRITVLVLWSEGSGSGKTQLAHDIARIKFGKTKEEIDKVRLSDVARADYFSGLKNNWSTTDFREEVRYVAGIHQSNVIEQKFNDVLLMVDDTREVDDQMMENVLTNFDPDNTTYGNNQITYDTNVTLIITANDDKISKIKGMPRRCIMVEVLNDEKNIEASVRNKKAQLLDRFEAEHGRPFRKMVEHEFDGYLPVLIKATVEIGGTMGRLTSSRRTCSKGSRMRGWIGKRSSSRKPSCAKTSWANSGRCTGATTHSSPTLMQRNHRRPEADLPPRMMNPFARSFTAPARLKVLSQ